MDEGGSELNSMTGMYDLPFRNYDAALGRFFQVDPMAVRTHTLSPFHYSGNNPVSLNDPTGLFYASRWTGMVRSLDDSYYATWNEDGIKVYNCGNGDGGPGGGGGASGSTNSYRWESDATVLAAAQNGDPEAMEEYGRRTGISPGLHRTPDGRVYLQSANGQVQIYSVIAAETGGNPWVSLDEALSQNPESQNKIFREYAQTVKDYIDGGQGGAGQGPNISFAYNYGFDNDLKDPRLPGGAQCYTSFGKSTISQDASGRVSVVIGIDVRFNKLYQNAAFLNLNQGLVPEAYAHEWGHGQQLEELVMGLASDYLDFPFISDQAGLDNSLDALLRAADRQNASRPNLEGDADARALQFLPAGYSVQYLGNFSNIKYP